MNFDQMINETQAFINQVARELGHPTEKNRTTIFIRAALHTLRERLTISHSLHLISQLPMLLKAIYVDGWKYRDTPVKFKNLEDFCAEVENLQSHYGEREFNWNLSTEEMVGVLFAVLQERYLSTGEVRVILNELPEKLQKLFECPYKRFSKEPPFVQAS